MGSSGSSSKGLKMTAEIWETLSSLKEAVEWLASDVKEIMGVELPNIKHFQFFMKEAEKNIEKHQ